LTADLSPTNERKEKRKENSKTEKLKNRHAIQEMSR
jgi:hypothetical protein